MTPAVLEDVLCGLFSFSTGAHGGWHEVESIMHVLVQLVVPGSQADDDHVAHLNVGIFLGHWTLFTAPKNSILHMLVARYGGGCCCCSSIVVDEDLDISSGWLTGSDVSEDGCSVKNGGMSRLAREFALK